jgi:hypothetical protein
MAVRDIFEALLLMGLFFDLSDNYHYFAKKYLVIGALCPIITIK